MPLNFITHNGTEYPDWQAQGNAARWILPLAQHILKDHPHGIDIGYSKEEWRYPGSFGVEPSIAPEYNAMNLPIYKSGELWDYIFSSHCLEHVKENWYNVLDYWLSSIKDGGILFLYLPHYSQKYWHPISNRKHIHRFRGDEIKSYLQSLGHKVYVSGPDHNNSFVVVCEKQVAYVVKYGEADLHGDVLMPGCFDKSIQDNHNLLHLSTERPTTSQGAKQRKG